MNKLRLGIIFGGRSQEHEVSIMSARSVYENINKDKYEIIPVAVSKEGYWLPPGLSGKVLSGEDEKISVGDSSYSDIADSLANFLTRDFDLVFPLIHGPFGEDGKIQGFLEMLGIPFIGTGVLSSAIGMDKGKMKEIFAYYHLPQARFMVFREAEIKQQGFDWLDKKIKEDTGYPCFIKPANMGSSIGVTKVNSSDNLGTAINEVFEFDRKAIVEEYIKGREIECSVLGNEDIEASLPGEIRPKHEFYDYEAKYKDEATELIIPAPLDEDTVKVVRDLAVRAFKAIDGQGFARVDFFLKDNKQVLLNEINTIPGFTRYSMYPKLWDITGLSYRDLIDKLVELALKK